MFISLVLPEIFFGKSFSSIEQEFLSTQHIPGLSQAQPMTDGKRNVGAH